MLKGFKQFLLRGNVIDLAVAVVIGGAFGKVVAALVADLLMPLIATLVGKHDFSDIKLAAFPIGDFINQVIGFVLIAAAIYFFVVVPVNAIMARARRGQAPPDPTTKQCPECLSTIPIQARRCAFCTSPVIPA
ncbi:MAG: large conductance mechanosensitive channel protein MscL [Bryobacteraceae bacterium]|jgi:large conductance mechanosensitive channel